MHSLTMAHSLGKPMMAHNSDVNERDVLPSVCRVSRISSQFQHKLLRFEFSDNIANHVKNSFSKTFNNVALNLLLKQYKNVSQQSIGRVLLKYKIFQITLKYFGTLRQRLTSTRPSTQNTAEPLALAYKRWSK